MTRPRGTLTLKRPAPPGPNREDPAQVRKLRLGASRAVIDNLMAKHPGTFDLHTPKPLKLDIGSEIAKARFGSWSACKLALYWWTNRPQYLAALAAPDAQRHDLDGTPLEPVSEEHRTHAAEMLAKRRPRAPAR